MNAIEPSVPRQADAVLAKRLHLSAIEEIQESVDSFAITLILQSKIEAYAEQAEVVLSRHVEKSLDHMVHRGRRNWGREALKIVGGALVGVFVPGLVTALPVNNIPFTILYIGLGFLGMLMVFLGFLI